MGIVFSDKVKFLPYIGEKYSSVGFRGLKTLIIGESHYIYDPAKCQTLEREFTSEHIKDARQNTKRYKFWTNLCSVLDVDISDTSNARGDFFKSICFYNFIQKPMMGTKSRPDILDWEAAFEPYSEVVSKLDPSFVLVTSLRAFRKLIDFNDKTCIEELGQLKIQKYIIQKKYNHSKTCNLWHKASIIFSLEKELDARHKK